MYKLSEIPTAPGGNASLETIEFKSLLEIPISFSDQLGFKGIYVHIHEKNTHSKTDLFFYTLIISLYCLLNKNKK